MAVQSFAQSNVNSSYIINIPSGYSLIANQLDHGSNRVWEVIPYADGDSVFVWNGTGWDAYTMDSISGTGWVDPAFNEILPANLPILSPGTGFLYGRSSGATTITFTGTPHVPVLPVSLPNGYGVYYPLARQTNDLGTYENITGRSPEAGAQVLTWNGASYVTNAYAGGVWTLGAPSLAVGQAAFIYVPAPSSPPCTSNLVVNGSFETTSPVVPPNTPVNNLNRTTGVPGWTTTVGNTLEVWGNTVNGLPASDGTNHMEINAQSNDQTVSQTVTNLSTNCPTTVCFDFAGRFGIQGSNYNNDFTFTISGGYTHTVDLNPPTYAGAWSNYCVTFTPTAPFVTLSFRGHPHYTNGIATQGGAHLDNVSLIQCCDTNPPCAVLIDCPTNKTVPCGSPVVFDSPVVVSNSCCATNFFAYTTTTNNSGCLAITRNWTIWDNCGNTNFCAQTVTLLDTNPPVFVGGCNTNIFLGGDVDNFGAPTAASPRPALLTRLQQAWGVTSTRSFDECAVNKWFAHSFTNLPKCITSAILEIRLKSCGDICGNDAMHLWFTGSANSNTVFSQYFGSGQTRAGLATNDWCSYSSDPQTFILDLSALPASGAGPANILSLLEANGFLDVTVQDDTAVDYVKLTIVSCCGNSTKTVECGSKWYFDMPVAVDDCCPNPTVTVLNTVTNGTCPKVITRTWLATDCCGNTNSTSQEVTLIDTKGPVIYNARNLTRHSCTVPLKVNYWVSAYDACAGRVNVTCTPPSGSLFNAGVTPVTCIATDACGNSTTNTFTVTVINDSLPDTRLMGIADCFKLFAEPAVKSSQLLAAHSGVSTWKWFDDSTPNRPFGASFMGLSNNITCATLEIRMRPNSSDIPENDSITLGLNTSNSIAVTTYIGGGNPSAGLTGAQWKNQGGCGQTFTIDLVAMGLLPTLNALHQLDIFIQDDTAVDYARLSYCYCTNRPKSLGWPWDISNADLANGLNFAEISPLLNPGYQTNFTATLLPGAASGVRLGLPVKQIGFLSNATLTATAPVEGRSVPTSLAFTGNGAGNVSVSLSSVAPEVTQIQATLKHNGAVVGQTTLAPSNNVPMIIIMHDGVEVASGEQGIIIMHDGVDIANLGTNGQDGIIIMEDGPMNVANLGSSGQDGIIIMEDGVDFTGLGSSGQDGVSVRNIGSSGQDGVDFANLGSSGQDGIIIMHDGVEFVRNLGSSGQDGVDFTARFANAGPIQLGNGAPVVADEVVLHFADPTSTADNVLTGLSLDGSGLDKIQVGGSAVRMGSLWAQVRGDAQAIMDGDQLSVTSLDPTPTNQCGIIIHLPVITDLHINLQQLDNPGTPANSNGVVRVAFIGPIGPNMSEVGGVSFKGDDDWGWVVSSSFANLGSTVNQYAIYDHGSNVASIAFTGTPHVPVLPLSIDAQNAGAKLLLHWNESQVLQVNGNNYVGDEIRITPVNPELAPSYLRVANIGSSGQDGVAISASVPLSVWRLQPLTSDGERLNVEWTGPAGGVLESATSLTGPWTIESGQSANAAEVVMPTAAGAPAKKFFRVRSN